MRPPGSRRTGSTSLDCLTKLEQEGERHSNRQRESIIPVFDRMWNVAVVWPWAKIKDYLSLFSKPVNQNYLAPTHCHDSWHITLYDIPSSVPLYDIPSSVTVDSYSLVWCLSPPLLMASYHPSRDWVCCSPASQNTSRTDKRMSLFNESLRQGSFRGTNTESQRTWMSVCCQLLGKGICKHTTVGPTVL